MVKFKDPEVKDTFEDIKPMTKWITPNDMSDALFEVRWFHVKFGKKSEIYIIFPGNAKLH